MHCKTPDLFDLADDYRDRRDLGEIPAADLDPGWVIGDSMTDQLPDDPLSAVDDDTPAWMSVKISLLETTDWKTAQRYLFERLEGLTVRLARKTGVTLVGQITDTLAIIEYDDRESEAGIRFTPNDDNDDPIPEQEFFVRYEDIEEIGVY